MTEENMKIRRSCCYTFLASIMKFLNFLQTFIGVAMILYSAYMLNIWNNHSVMPSPSPSPDYSQAVLPNPPAIRVSDSLNIAADYVSDDGFGLELHFFDLPAPWFIYAFMGMGILLCCINFIGHIAADFSNRCCLGFYALFVFLLMMLESALVAFVALDHQWEKDLPLDPTGQLDTVRLFIEENIDICKWVGIVVMTIQALSLLIAMILRTVCSSYDLEGAYDAGGGKTWKMLLNPPPSQKIWSRPHSDIWSSLMREKYGLSSGDAKQKLLNQTPSINAKPKQ
ncbi:tetraspanin family protein [Actinidia rufa]|uniref:Tetraspanin family protein n=1 Tax=Actinidia rufa TaxID=165716 RepID=A0A7J0FLB2_9ERIC|nr:tetraspanin family protein [Actinidia rufa]